MATVYSSYYGDPADANVPAAAANPGGKSVAQRSVGVYEIAAALSKNDVIKLFKIPKGARIVDFTLKADDLDTGTEALELDVGKTGDTDALLNSGVITGDAFAAGHLPANATATTMPVHLHGNGDDLGQKLTADTEYFATVVAAANAGGTGTVIAYCDWVMEDY